MRINFRDHVDKIVWMKPVSFEKLHIELWLWPHLYPSSGVDWHDGWCRRLRRWYQGENTKRYLAHLLAQGGPGPFQFSKQQKQVRFQQTHNRGLRPLFVTVSWDLCAQRATPEDIFVYLYLRSNVRVEVEGPWRVPCPLKKPFKGSRPRLGSCWRNGRE